MDSETLIEQPAKPDAAESVVAYVRDLLSKGEVKPGDRLPAERDLALEIGVSRPSVRAGLQALAAMGVVDSRRGSGTYISTGPPVLSSGPLQLLAILHGIPRAEIFEARRVLEARTARLAVERAAGESLAEISEEVMGMFASTGDPQEFLLHDIRFHRAVARASGNMVLSALVEMVSEIFYEQRKATAGLDRDLRISAEEHRRIYQAIRDRDPDAAERELDGHLRASLERQERENRNHAQALQKDGNPKRKKGS
ncbi:MAG TPA: FadR/GntR family transcriptional regulator [Thermoanaerobaculaceae bacterium]|nr:FadR/GntR family transcriptional regulator [Thermoanaerobaculaceae bacterium]HPS76627.1 FadR/GntR family transcriptional regulator [Thermoanaerobaculaceae bacterium]